MARPSFVTSSEICVCRFFTIAAIMLVVQGDSANGDPCRMPDLYGIFKFCVYPMYMDLAIVTINIIFLTFRALTGQEKILEAVMEPRVIERILVHLFPLLIVVLLALTAQSIPMCYLSPDYRDTGFCRVFRADVVKGCLIGITILLFMHFNICKRVPSQEADQRNRSQGHTHK